MKKFRLFLGLGLVSLMLSVSPVNALTINLTYDSSVTSLSNAAQVETACNYAVQRIQGLITNNVTVNITVVAVAGTGTFGESVPTLDSNYYTYNQIRGYFSSRGSLPLADPTGGGTFVVPTAQARMLGLSGATAASDGTFYFGTGYSFTFDPNNRAVSGKYDFIGVAEHEITHILGRVSGLGQDFGNGKAGYYPYDLFRFSGNGVHSLTNSAGDYFSINNGLTDLDPYDTQSDPADWAQSVVGDAFIAFTPPDEQNGIGTVDFDVMYVLGYNLNSASTVPAVTSSTSATGFVGQGFSYTIAATNSPISYGVITGLPSWLTVNQTTGVISGTPPTAGTYTLTISASNALGPGLATLTLNVAATDLFGGTSAGANLNLSPWFGYYTTSTYPLVYQYNLGYEYVFAGGAGVYLYDYTTGHFWYTQSNYFPFVYDFTLQAYLYYYSGNGNPRYFLNTATNQVISQ